ncbi:MAG: methyltransferase domain-containing protein [Bacteroidetes bacterium]|nr:methyltransferase domain-containing protein [Bacteroidota bacterium]
MRFKTTEHELTIGQRLYRILSVTNFDELYDELVSKGLQHEEVADERIPYWAELWPSALGLALHIATYPDLIRHKATLEIGGGLGLPALVAGALEAEVTSTDYLQDAVDFARENAERNGITDMTFQTLDWRNSSGIAPCEVLLASDVAYERRQFEPLLKAFEALVKPDGLILLSEPNRYIAEPLIAELQASGYNLKKYSYEVAIREVKSKVSVYEIKRT